KYTIKPPRDLCSRFEQEQEVKKQQEIRAQEQKRLREEEERLMEAEKAKPDALHGLRVHSWVLVLSGKREVPENFFIDPFTGHSYSTQDEHFLGIESLWNHKNYWINMQDCWNCCKVPRDGELGGHSRHSAGDRNRGKQWQPDLGESGTPGHEGFEPSP
ncbi:DRC7 isoform 8, partial [Pongo abelii]